MMGGGICAIVAPFAASLVVETVVGISLIVGGVIALVQIFVTEDGWSARVMFIVLGLFNTAAGALLIFRPLQGLMALTLVMITAFMINGLMRIAVGVMARPKDGSAWVIFGGVVGVVASGYLMSRYPENSVILLGLVAAFALISEGAGYARFAYGLKNASAA